mgnify:CR=1 FL=1
MYQRTITKATLTAFHRHLQEAERRPATIAKYLREVQDFARHLEPGQPVEKETVLAWKAALAQRYAAGTVTGTLVGALIIATLNVGMTLMGVSYFWQLVIKGAVIIIAVLIDKYRTRHHQSA